MKILIVKIGALGDVLRTTFLLPGLKRKYPDCTISWVTSRKAFGLLKNNVMIDNVYSLDEKEKVPKEFDLVISLDDEKETAELVSGVEKEKLIGAYLDKGIVRYTENSADWFGMGLLRSETEGGKKEADRLKKENKRTYQEIIAKIVGVDCERERPLLKLTEEDIQFGKKFAEKNGIKKGNFVVGLNTGAGKRWPLKKWSIDNTAQLTKELNSSGKKAILFGGKDEKDRNNKIVAKAGNNLIDAGVDNSLREFASLINLCDILVCSDSLSLHLAIALKKKVVVLFGPTSAAEIELYDSGIKIIADEDYLATYIKSDKPDIMKKIRVEDVLEAIERLRKGSK